MIAYLLRPILFLSGIFTLGLLMLRLLPYSDSDLRPLFVPDDCAQPCFMGIRPGETTIAEAVALLESHAWVGEISQQPDLIMWAWNGSQPGDLFGYNAALVGTITGTDVVERVGIRTSIPAFRLLLLYGAPDWCTAGWVSSDLLGISSFYNGGQIGLHHALTFAQPGEPIDRRHHWQSSVTITFGPGQSSRRERSRSGAPRCVLTTGGR